jgi:hypothetical protein
MWKDLENTLLQDKNKKNNKRVQNKITTICGKCVIDL